MYRFGGTPLAGMAALAIECSASHSILQHEERSQISGGGGERCRSMRHKMAALCG